MDSTAAQNFDLPRTVTTAELLSSQLQGGRIREVGTRTLVIGDVAVAIVSNDVARLNPITATSSTEMSALETLAALCGHEPSGVMVIERASSGDCAAFELDQGRIIGAREPGPLGDLRRWAKELFRRFPDRVTTPPPGETEAPGAEWVRMARDYVRELALTAMEMASAPGARITLLRGDVRWKGPTLPPEDGIGLQHLLLERARRDDELPRMLELLGDLEQLALPMCTPGSMPPGGKPTPDGEADGWGDAKPDEATMAAWKTARQVYGLCDGERSLVDIIEYGLLGRFRTLEALILLARSQNVVMATAPSQPQPTAKLLRLPQGRATPKASAPITGYMLAQRGQTRLQPRHPLRERPRPMDGPERIPTRTRVEPHEDVITPKPPSVRNANVGGGKTLLDALETEIAMLDAPEPGAPTRAPTQHLLLTVVGSLLFGAGVAFSMLVL